MTSSYAQSQLMISITAVAGAATMSLLAGSRAVRRAGSAVSLVTIKGLSKWYKMAQIEVPLLKKSRLRYRERMTQGRLILNLSRAFLVIGALTFLDERMIEGFDRVYYMTDGRFTNH